MQFILSLFLVLPTVTFASKSYLSLDLPYPPFEKIRLDLEKSQKLTLKSRGEAHITVLTPPEVKALADKLTWKEIQGLAHQLKIQESPYKLLCVGKGVHKTKPAEGETYYVVVESERLFEIRRKIQALYVGKGGDPKNFNPEKFYPHVTLGFVKRDLHLEDGVLKNTDTCLYSL